MGCANSKEDPFVDFVKNNSASQRVDGVCDMFSVCGKWNTISVM